MSEKARGHALIEDAKERAMDVYHDFVLALRRIESGDTERVKIRPRQKVTPALLAREAGRARSQLYATHRDLLDRIKEVNSRRDLTAQKAKKVIRKSEQELRATIDQLNKDKRLLAQQNYSLQRKIEELESRRS